MNTSDIVRLLNTNHYAPADLEEVNKLCRNFPEFSTAHMLKVRIMEALNYEKKQQLKLAAVYSMDRKKLFQLVTEVVQPPEPEMDTETRDEALGIIQFSDKPNEHADVIIEQHAPYAGQQDVDTDLLELDEEPGEELLELVDEEVVEERATVAVKEEESAAVEEEEPEKEPLEDALLTAVEKDETEMEEPGPEAVEVPAIDQIQNPQEEKGSNHLITRFIKGEPGPIRADQKTSLKGDVSLSSIREHDGFITDTLAQIYVKQGLYAKAIYAYEKLSLKYPEKSAYFAAQIEKIRNINH